MKNQINRHKTFLINEFKEYSYCDKKMIQATGGEYEIPFATQKTDGKHSLESCENCRGHYDLLVSELTTKFDKFPNCCDFHKNLNNLDFFKKEDYVDFANITANKILFCYHHIINNLDNEDWFNDIKDYLEYTIESYGSLPAGYGEPLELSNFYRCLLHLINGIENKVSSEVISKVEIKTRMNRVKYLLSPIENDVEENTTDLNLLWSTYDDWYKIFPFDLPYFKHLKDKFKNIVPLHTGRQKTNRYSKVTTYEVHTKNSLTVALLQITKNIITSINGATLFEKGQLNNAEKIKLDLILNNRKLELYELSKMQNNSKTEYIKILKKWFKSEKNFIEEIAPFTNKQIEPKAKYEPTKAQILENKLNQYNFDSLDKVTENNKTSLINKIANSDLPMQIAYLDYLGFINHLNNNHSSSGVALHKLIADILKTTERAVRGNINGIRNIKSTDRKRYTAYQHQENVEKHYATLK